ncbi:LysM peptidoglycan-binding domain-containing protein [Desulfobacterota bacterium AH_259_B03_O07]|nr:LysM peptidoglycan-binding domain-containing protein [Desulfobacterota bacterium AH_259_B03_O07]
MYGTGDVSGLGAAYGKDSLGRSFAIPSNRQDLFLRDKESRFFLLEPNSQTWSAYYYFFYLRDDIYASYPEFDPKRKEFPVVLNPRVTYYIGYFQTSGRKFFEKWLERSGKYIPMMTEILKRKGLPPDLVYLAMIESGFNVKARSHAAAVGPWQFIKPTALRYGLRVDSWADDRMDPEKSTIAAANYLADLYDMFQSWELAAAGYNCGEHRVQAAIDQYNLYDYWLISEFTLPKETRDYVPKLMAALIITKNPEKYGFSGIYYEAPIRYEKAYVPPQKNLSEIASVIGANGYSLRELNPGLKHGVTPPGGLYQVKVPPGFGKVVAAKKANLSSLRTVASVGYSGGGGTSKYRVKRGDSLGKIARRHRVSVSSIKRANGLKGSTIRTEQVLRIPGKGSGGSGPKYASISNRSTVRYKVRNGDTLGAIAARHQVSVSNVKSANNIRGTTIFVGQSIKIPNAAEAKYVARNAAPYKYKVRKGDTLGVIAQRSGVSVSSIKSANNIRGTTIRSGQTLTISGGKGSGSTYARSSGKPVKYKVRKGDTLGKIAARHGVSVSSIKSANNIRGTTIRSGQTLTISGGKGSGSTYARSSGKPVKYKVRKGDTLGKIASRHGVSVSSIKSANNLRGTTIRSGQTLTIPGGKSRSYASKSSAPVKYKVRRGDTLGSIARKHGVTVASIKAANNLMGSTIIAGQILTIPSGKRISKRSSKGSRG